MKSQRGVALLVILMIAGVMGAFFALRAFNSAGAERDKVTATTQALAQANDALLGFAIANGRLPCPADPTLVSGAVGAGLARLFPVGGTCTGGLSGALPWATLGLSETDAWGNRYTYRVTKEFADPGTLFGLATLGDSTIRVTSGGAILASTLPAVIVSHGKNGSGAYNTNGKQVLPISTDADEVENSDGNPNFVSKTPTATFDDIVTWLSPNILFNRMQKAGKL